MGYKIAVIGASGAVGQEILQILTEKDLPIDDLVLFGSHRSAGREYECMGKKWTVRELKDNDDFKDIDIALASAGSSISKKFEKTITKHGTMLVDNSSAFRLDKEVPLVVPEVNPEDAKERPRNVIANPNCTTIQMVVALKPIEDLSHITKVRVSTYQSASGSGAAGMEELKTQLQKYANNQSLPVEEFDHQLLLNVIPHIDVLQDNLYFKEEMKMYNETKKIMHSDVEVSATCVRVPVMRNHSESIWVETERELSLEEVKDAFSNAKGIKVIDNPGKNEYPMPLYHEGEDEVFVGRIREDLTEPKGKTFWCVSDQIRKGAALNTVQIAELVLNKKWL